MLDSLRIAALQHAATTLWHAELRSHQAPEAALEQLALAQHRANFDLWHQEDAARDPEASSAIIAEVKHTIDRLNQTRNDLVEQIDVLLLGSVQQQPSAALHSETPGLIIDRLSILSLKLFHTEEQTARTEASEAHRERNRQRLALLTEQRNDLAACLAALWTDITAGRRRFKLYRQMKMYNDPTLNPVLYRAPAHGAPPAPGSR